MKRTPFTLILLASSCVLHAKQFLPATDVYSQAGRSNLRCVTDAARGQSLCVPAKIAHNASDGGPDRNEDQTPVFLSLDAEGNMRAENGEPAMPAIVEERQILAVTDGGECVQQAIVVQVVPPRARIQNNLVCRSVPVSGFESVWEVGRGIVEITSKARDAALDAASRAVAIESQMSLPEGMK